MANSKLSSTFIGAVFVLLIFSFFNCDSPVQAVNDKNNPRDTTTIPIDTSGYRDYKLDVAFIDFNLIDFSEIDFLKSTSYSIFLEFYNDSSNYTYRTFAVYTPSKMKIDSGYIGRKGGRWITRNCMIFSPHPYWDSLELGIYNVVLKGTNDSICVPCQIYSGNNKADSNKYVYGFRTGKKPNIIEPIKIESYSRIGDSVEIQLIYNDTLHIRETHYFYTFSEGLSEIEPSNSRTYKGEIYTGKSTIRIALEKNNYLVFSFFSKVEGSIDSDYECYSKFVPIYMIYP